MWNAKKEDDRVGPQFEEVDASIDELNKSAALTYGDDHLAAYRYRQGLLLLHLLTAVMLGPSLAAWVQVSCFIPSHLMSVVSTPTIERLVYICPDVSIIF